MQHSPKIPRKGSGKRILTHHGRTPFPNYAVTADATASRDIELSRTGTPGKFTLHQVREWAPGSTPTSSSISTLEHQEPGTARACGIPSGYNDTDAPNPSKISSESGHFCSGQTGAACQAAIETSDWSGEEPSLGSDYTDDETDIRTYPSQERHTLSPGHRFAGLKNKLADDAYATFSCIMTDRPGRKRKNDGTSTTPKPKRSRSSTNLETQASSPVEWTVSSLPPKAQDTASLCCPFFAHKNREYQDCLKSNLISAIDVKRHIWAAHRRPYHCPACGTVFPAADEWEGHIRTARCDQRAFKLEGVSEDQLERLSIPSGSRQSREEQWYSIWGMVFPGIEPPSTPFLPNDSESAHFVSLLRDYWATEGHKFVNSFLKSKGIRNRGGQKETRNRQSLQRLVLDRMIDKLLAGLNRSDDGARSLRSSFPIRQLELS